MEENLWVAQHGASFQPGQDYIDWTRFSPVEAEAIMQKVRDHTGYDWQEVARRSPELLELLNAVNRLAHTDAEAPRGFVDRLAERSFSREPLSPAMRQELDGAAQTLLMAKYHGDGAVCKLAGLLEETGREIGRQRRPIVRRGFEL